MKDNLQHLQVVREAVDIDKVVGYKVKEARRRLKLSQKDFAAKLGISYPAFAMYERGQRAWKVPFLAKCARLLGVQFKDLLAVEK